MLAYHNDPAVKAKYIARVRAHRIADSLTQGIGWDPDERKGCAVGCTLESYDHSRYPLELGIPLQIAHLEDTLFELLDVKGAQAWPERFLAAIGPGADLSRVWADWSYWMLLDPHHGMLQHAGGRSDVEAAIGQVAALYGPEAADWAAADRADRAAEAADWAAARAARAAEAADWAARAARAAWAAADRATWVDAACDKLIDLLEAA